MWTYFDDVLNLFYVVNKGSPYMQMFYFSERGESKANLPELVPLNRFDGQKISTQYMYFMPKQSVDPLKKEVQRAIRFTGKNADFISFKMPKKGEEYRSDVYPPHRARNSAMTFDEWSQGINKEPLKE
jgi:hypothetical protein